MSITGHFAKKIGLAREVLARLDHQVICSDVYAKDARRLSESDKLPSVWEIQNGHVKDLLAELREILGED